MIFINQYDKLKKDLEKKYVKPSDENFKQREFGKIRWKNTQSQNFFVMIKVLCEEGYCTVRDITENDGLSTGKKARKKRHDEYDRLIKGVKEKSVGFVDQYLIIPEKKDWKTHRNNRFRLSILGMLYAIHIFSEKMHHPDKKFMYRIKFFEDGIEKEENSKVTKYKNSILEVLVENYSDMLPLIFGKWKIIVPLLQNMVNRLVDIAHLSDSTLDTIKRDPILSLRSIYMKDWNDINNNQRVDEITALFYGMQNFTSIRFRNLISKDKDIHDWYERYLSFLIKANKEDELSLRCTKYLLNGDYEKAEIIGKRIHMRYELDSKDFKLRLFP